MPYLTLNGNKTENLNVYLRDVLFLNFNCIPADIPFNTELGVEKYILEESRTEYTDKVRTAVSSLLDRINTRHKSNLSISNIDMTFTTIDIEIDFGDSTAEVYEIPLSEL